MQVQPASLKFTTLYRENVEPLSTLGYIRSGRISVGWPVPSRTRTTARHCVPSFLCEIIQS
jgi:hypothetical protein